MNKRIVALIVTLQFLALGAMGFMANQTSILRDNVGRILEEELMVRKSVTWWCPSGLEWHTVTVSGEDATVVCAEFEDQKIMAQRKCPPGMPPGPPPSGSGEDE